MLTGRDKNKAMEGKSGGGGNLMNSPSKSGCANENTEKLSLLHDIYSRWAGISRKNRNLDKNIETSFHFFFKKTIP